MIKRSILVLIATCCGLVSTTTARAEVVHRNFSNETFGGFFSPGIDFDQDSNPELAFDFYALGHESGGVFFLTAHSAANTELLRHDWGVLPLNWGEPISTTNPLGQWANTGFGSAVWFQAFTSGEPVIIFTPGEGISTNTPPPAPPGQGVGMPGFGNFMGVRFLLADGWHYGWVRFGTPESGFFFGPALLDYAYETRPDTAILAGAGIDSDNDGVWDLVDECSDTPVGEAVDASGCSISQLVPCDGPWKNHGEYVARIIATVAQFQRQRLITPAEARAIVRAAARSDCGKPRAPREHQGRIDRERENHAADQMRIPQPR